MTGSFYSVNRNSSTTGTGLHTLVEGLTISPSPSPASSSSSSSSSSTSSSSIPAATTTQPSFNSPGPSSIFNNHPDQSYPSTPVPTPCSTPINGGGSGAQSFTARKLGHAGSAGQNTGSAVKEVDDPTSTPPSSNNKAQLRNSSRSSHDSLSPAAYSPNARCSSYRGSDSVKLEDFLYTRGFREGACSDITVTAFGTPYRLHRLILDRSPFFSSCFNGGPWAESDSSEITLSPETADPNITQHAFELALARLYGHVDTAEEDKYALPLLAAASFLELQDLAESCVTSLLKNLGTGGITEIVTFVTNSYYGPLTDRLLESAKALLYRDGWEMDFAQGWDGISGEFAAEIIGYDGFYCPNEYARYCFVRNLINWRQRQNLGSPVEEAFLKVPEHPVPGGSMHAAFDDVSDMASTIGEDEAEVKPLRDLLESGIYYCHMDFAQLQLILEDADVFGRPMVKDTIIKDALWQQMLLRQKVLRVPIDSPELGITKMEYLPTKSTRNLPRPASAADSRKTARTALRLDPFDSERKPRRKHAVPSEDSSTTVIGDCPEQSPRVGASGHPRGSSAGPGDPAAPNGDPDDKETEAGEEVRYSEFPPFRFSAEFKSIRSLKERKRVYSKTVFYAGSYWNIYIQKVVKSTKNTQLGVYLHRAKDREGSGSGSSSGRDTEQLLGVISTSQKVDAEDGDTTLVEGDTTVVVPPRPGANTSASRSLPGGNVTTSSPPADDSVPALGLYVDTRPMIQTYFKIFSPSRKGKMLSMFSSRPDSFNFSQSWGWKSSSLILDDVLNDKDTTLRFMVVLGNV